MNDVVSVIIPVYKVETYIDSCMNGVLNQSYKNLEIILVDDGSPDNCPAICDRYAQNDSRVRVIHKKNGGLSDARNAGLDVATGKYVVFIDSDDAVSCDYVEYLYGMLKEHPEALISACGVMQIQQGQVVSEDTHREYFTFSPEYAFENLLYAKGLDVCSYAKMYDISLFSDIRFPVGKVYEDSATTYLLFEKSPEIIYGNKMCYYYYTRPGSISKAGAFNKNEYDYIEHTKQMLDYLSEHYPSIQGAVDRYYVYSKFRILRMLVYSAPRDKAFEKSVMKEIKSKRKGVLFDKNTPKRDKIAIILSASGISVYKLSWRIYCRLTGRMLY